MCEQIVQTLFSHVQSLFEAPPPVLQSTEKGSEEKLNVIPLPIFRAIHIAGTLEKGNETIEQYMPYMRYPKKSKFSSAVDLALVRQTSQK